MLRSKFLLKKLVPGSSLQYNLSARQISNTSTKLYSTSIHNLEKKPTDQQNGESHYEEALKENKTATQIDLRSQNTGMIEGSRINHFIKKKDIGMTDDESTVKGKVVAKTKDFTAFIFAGGAAIALGYALYVLAKEYFMKKPEDYAYERDEMLFKSPGSGEQLRRQLHRDHDRQIWPTKLWLKSRTRTRYKIPGNGRPRRNHERPILCCHKNQKMHALSVDGQKRRRLSLHLYTITHLRNHRLRQTKLR